jgi:hypothetical protein
MNGLVPATVFDKDTRESRGPIRTMFALARKRFIAHFGPAPRRRSPRLALAKRCQRGVNRGISGSKVAYSTISQTIHPADSKSMRQNKNARMPISLRLECAHCAVEQAMIGIITLIGRPRASSSKCKRIADTGIRQFVAVLS